MEKISLRDQLFPKEKVEKIAQEITNVFPSFKATQFVTVVINAFPTLGLTERIKWITTQLKHFLPDDYQEAVTVLLRSLPPRNDPHKTDNDFGDFIYAPYSDFIAAYGLNKKNLHFSLAALKECTMRFSAEEPLRHFINAFPKETMKEIEKWSRDNHYQVRRLASEGTRPKLPWAVKIHTPIEDMIPILDNLFYDNTRFVTRSVANHLNDIAKINPTLAVATLKRWKKSQKQDPKEMEYIIQHALRSLIKTGNAEAITFLQLSTNPEVTLSNFQVSNTVAIGTPVEFTFTLIAQKDEQLIIDYVLYFQNKAGKMESKKVFKLKNVTMAKDQTLMVVKKHRMYHFSTRQLYPGTHKIEIQINGKKMTEKTFNLTASLQSNQP